MKLADIPAIRLFNQQITQTKFTKPEELVKYLGAVQSQDFFGAKWALGLRLPGSNDAEIEQAFNEGKILRTHALRPTWHFVDPSDIRWMVELNTPQVKKIMNYYNKKLELDDSIFRKTNSIIEKSLRGKNFLTRTELSKKINAGGIKATGQRLGHIVGWAELDGIICSGPKKGKQFTYALIDEVAPNSKSFSRDESLAKLAEIFFKSRGPATVKDFSKWSGLSMADSRKGLESVKSHFSNETIDGKEYWFSSLPKTIPQSPTALLLPNYDEYISSYSDYSIISTPETRKNLDKIGNALFWNHMIIDGMIVGSWRRVFKPKVVEIEFAPLRNLNDGERIALEQVTRNYGKFLNSKIDLKFSL